MPIIRRNHYVPIWYQKRFLPPGQRPFFYLDFHPERKELSDGRIITMNDMHRWGPNKCFCKQDLYTTSIFGVPNDEIERFLFGAIDREGSVAIRALVEQDLQTLYHLFKKVFEYLDAQKLRTPKGLDWIRSHYPKLTQIELMLEMQHLRQMHCTMWVEAVREIVSAEDSDVKFIITDHPVTVYNPACPPSSLQCKYPDDPSIALKASQTIFPVDLNHCLILTNLEYARNPDSVDPLSKRTHARYFGQTLARFDTMIRIRRLHEEEVATINLILKSRARRFIAATKKEWLYPEATIQSSWAKMGKVLLPPENELWHFGGEIYVGGKDGKLAYYQDEFGRTLGEISALRKDFKKGKVGRNEPCPCGSGKKYKKCCLNKPEPERPSTTEYSIRERNIILFNAVTDILSLSKGKTWEDVRRELSDDQVKEIHKVISSLWHRETNIMDLLPRPDSAILRALYAGLVDPRVILRNVIGFSLYTDEIIVLSPFTNPACVKEEYSPVHSPTQYKQETIKNVLLLMQLAPFIEAGIVNMIPDPCDFDYSLRKQIWDMARERLKNWEPSREEYAVFEPLYKEDIMRSMWCLPKENLKRQISKAVPHISDEDMEKILEHIEEMRVHDPFALLQTLPSGKEGGQLLKSQLSPNLELGLFLSQMTGSFIYTDNLHRWNEILGAIREEGMSRKNWALVAECLSTLCFTFLNNVDPQTTFAIRQSGRLGDFRKVLRQIWMNVQRDLEPDSVEVMIQRIPSELKEAHQKAHAEWHSIQKELQVQSESPFVPLIVTVNGKIDFRIPSAGFGLNTVYRLLLSHSGRTDYLRYLPMAAFIEFDSR
jgi:hypothetical protein